MKKSAHTASWRVIALVSILAFLLGACGGAEPTGTQQVPQETVEITAQAPAGQAGEEGGPTLNSDVSGTIELWHFWASPVRRNAIRRVIAICQQKLPNITVVDTVKPFGDIWTANIAAVAAGSGMPDVIISDRPKLPIEAEQGIFTDLKEWADRDGVTRDQFYDWAWDQAVYEEGVYGIPFETDVRVLFWNKQLFEAAGLDPNKPPENWSQLEEYADKLDVKNADGTYQRIGFMPLWNGGFDLWTYNNNADMIADDDTPQINNPNAVETMEWIKSWIDRYGGWQAVQDFRAKFGAPPNDLFMGNGVAMLVDIFGYNSQLEFYRPYADTAEPIGEIGGDDPRMDWGIGLVPTADDAEPANISAGFALSIPTGAKNAEAAWEFIKCATSAEGQSSWARDTQALPTNIAAATDPILQSNPNWQIVDQALSTSVGGDLVVAYPNWAEQLDQRYEGVWTGQMTPQEALDEAQQAVQDQIGQ